MRKRKAKTKNKRVNKTNKSKRCLFIRDNKHLRGKSLVFNDKKVLVLFLGAGAAKAWNGPLCSDIDPIIRTDTKFRTRTNNTPIGEFIYHKLEDFYGTPNAVNFETFLGALEGIFDFVMSNSNSGGTSPGNTSFSPTYLNFQDWIEEIKDYQVVNNGNGMVDLYYPRGNSSFDNIEEDIIDRVYFSKLFVHYYQLVLKSIEDYIYDIKNERFEELNNALIKFISYYQAQGYNVRVYTTNYDRLFPSIIRDKCKVFDGFNWDDGDNPGSIFDYNVSKVLNDVRCLCHYNLHGCIYWNWHFLEPEFKYDFRLTPYLTNTEINFNDLVPTNPNQIIVPINIITGYNKLQRISLEPLNAMFNTFLYDCNRADLLITVGYSFGDYHLNRILKHAIKPNKTRDYHISYQSDPSSYLDSSEFYNLKDMYRNAYGTFREGNEWIISSKGDFKKKVYLNGFDQFLLNERWKRQK